MDSIAFLFDKFGIFNAIRDAFITFFVFEGVFNPFAKESSSAGEFNFKSISSSLSEFFFFEERFLPLPLFLGITNTIISTTATTTYTKICFKLKLFSGSTIFNVTVYDVSFPALSLAVKIKVFAPSCKDAS